MVALAARDVSTKGNRRVFFLILPVYEKVKQY